jgi:molybdopterin synthase sulfur carrier subunit
VKVKLKTFGIARDILGGKEVLVEVEGTSVADLRQELETRYPQLTGLRSLFIAVNQSYAADTLELNESDEIALIPPVSGG